MQTTHAHYHTHTCGELRMEHVGQTVTLAGFLENVCEVSQNFTFAVLRDFYSVAQVAVENEAMWKAFKGLNRESTVQIIGVVRGRDSKNPRLLIGDIEVVPEAVKVLGRYRHNELPFQINRSRGTGESARLKHRYLNLRSPKVENDIIPRCQVVAALRKAILDHDFLEITTPILTVSSPEGTWDCLVPSRKHPGKFYALPQAPQQLKQLLMASGFDKYFQITSCFRDKDARGGRSPDEFYRLSMEMAFTGQEGVFAVLENVLPPIFARYGTCNVASAAPFHRISYREAMDKYGPDEPNLRVDLVVTGTTEALGACGSGPFEGNAVKTVVITGFEGTCKQIDKLCAGVEVQSDEKTCRFRYDENGEIVGDIAKFAQPAKDVVVAALELEKGYFVSLTAGKLLAVRKTAGALRSKLGTFCPNHMDKERCEFYWVADFPVYEIGEESGPLEFCHNPFSMPNGGLEILKKAAAGGMNPLSITAFQYDLVCNDVELPSDVTRDRDPEIIIEAFQFVRLGKDDVRAEFPAMYNAFTYDAPPHADIAPNVNCMVMLLAGKDSIREIVPFSMNKNAQDLMMGAPSSVAQAQLDELDIVCTRKEEDKTAE